MNSILLSIILIPVIEIYLFIKIGSQIGAITTILLIFTTAIVGIYYAKYEGLNTLKAGFSQLSKNEAPTYEMMSGAAIAFAALLLIIPIPADCEKAWNHSLNSSVSISPSFSTFNFTFQIK